MRHQLGTAAILAAVGLTFPALAQDSVSSNLGGLPGDALSAWNELCAAYVVDLAPFTTSQGNVFGIAPIMKASKSSAEFFNSLGSSVTISPDVLTGSTFSRPSYSVWDTAGQGVGVNNSTPGSISPTGAASRFAVGYTEFGTTILGASYNGILGAVVSFDPANPNRLYVDRRSAAVNMDSEFTFNSSQIGGVSIDANGNVYYRGDGQNASGPGFLTGNNIYRTRLLDRNCGVPNLVSNNASLANATDRLISDTGITHSVPSSIPASIAGGNGVYAGPNFDTQYVYGSVPGVTTATMGHLDFSGGHRGSFGGTAHQALGSGVYTFAVSAQNPVQTGISNVINLFSVNASGAVVDTKGFIVPTSLTDNDSGFTVNYTATEYQSRHHTGPTAFRGGVGTVAVGSDQAGRTLIAKTIQQRGTAAPAGQTWDMPQIAVGRFSDPDGTVEWTMAAYIDLPNALTEDEGKAIYNGDGVRIGNLVNFDRVPTAPQGPSMSVPAIDSVGNVWFFSLAELYGEGFEGASAFRTCLFRAVYNPAEFSYRLELVAAVSDIFQGQNSGLDYRLSFLSTTTGTGTPAPESLWSTAMADNAWNNVSTAGLDTSDPITNGGLVISASIIYDVDGDGIFNNPNSNFFDPELPADEAYDVALYIGYYDEGEEPCLADFNGDQSVNVFDVFAFLNAFAAQDPSADLAEPINTFNVFDVFAFLSIYSAGCP